MTLITRTVSSNSAEPITLDIPGYDAKRTPVVIPAHTASFDLLGGTAPITVDQLEALQPTLALLVSDGSLSVVATFDTTSGGPY